MSRTVEFLNSTGTFFVATDDNGQPRVRPFSAVMDFQDKIYFCTNNQKPVYRQLTTNPKLEISGFAPNGQWIRIAGTAVFDADLTVKAAMLEAIPSLQRMYSAEDSVFEIFYLENAEATISSFSSAPETYKV